MSRALLFASFLFTAGCVAALPEPPPQPPPDPCLDCGAAVTGFPRALEAMLEKDRSRGWDAASCDAIAGQFLAASHDLSSSRYWAEPVYNAALVRQRCGAESAARELYEDILKHEPRFHRARVQRTRIDLDHGKLSLDAAITELSQAVRDAQYQNAEALMELARLQMKRDNAVPDSDGPSDMARAKKNLQRALAVDDAHMPTFNQLGLYYLTMAKRNPARSDQKGAPEGLDLALLITSQGIRKDVSYAPLRNTAGLIFYELGDLTRASASFAKARELDPTFFDAQMNFASLNVMVRGFSVAEQAYRTALELKPNDYDALLGLALALRGQIESSANGEALTDEAEATLQKAITLTPERPEAYFNLAILYESYRSRSPLGGHALETAIQYYRQFAERAKGKPELAAVVNDVLAVPTKSDEACMQPEASHDAACKRGRIFDLEDLLK